MYIEASPFLLNNMIQNSCSAYQIMISKSAKIEFFGGYRMALYYRVKYVLWEYVLSTHLTFDCDRESHPKKFQISLMIT